MLFRIMTSAFFHTKLTKVEIQNVGQKKFICIVTTANLTRPQRWHFSDDSKQSECWGGGGSKI